MVVPVRHARHNVVWGECTRGEVWRHLPIGVGERPTRRRSTGDGRGGARIGMHRV